MERPSTEWAYLQIFGSPFFLVKTWPTAGTLRWKKLNTFFLNPCDMRSNQEWAVDFACDGLATGRGIRILAIVDAFTRECLTLEVDTSLSSQRVTRALEQAIEQRGLPESIRCDNGPELTSRHFLGWCEERKIQLIHIQPGRPMQNGHAACVECALYSSHYSKGAHSPFDGYVYRF